MRVPDNRDEGVRLGDAYFLKCCPHPHAKYKVQKQNPSTNKQSVIVDILNQLKNKCVQFL